MKYNIGVSGSAVNNCAPGAYAKAREVGRQIALHHSVCITGDTGGVPHAAAHGAKSAKGSTVGISPASSEEEHLRKFKLPNDHLDIKIYTGFQFSGRNLLFIRACDAVIFICGRIGTLNEFTIAFEDKKTIGVLTETGGVMDEIHHILDVAKRGKANIVFDNDPKRLVERVLEEIKVQDCSKTKGRRACLVIKGNRK